MSPLQIASIVLYIVTSLIYLLSLFHFWRRRHLPAIRHRSPLLSVISAFFSFGLLTLLFALILQGLDSAPSLATMILGIFFSSGFLRPFLVRAWVLSKTYHRNNLANFPSLEGDSSLNLTKQNLSPRLRLCLEMAGSVAIDFVTIMIIVALRPEFGFGGEEGVGADTSLMQVYSSAATATGYLVLLDWYVFAGFLGLFALLLLWALKSRGQNDVYGIYQELLTCFVVIAVTFAVYVASLHGAFASAFGPEPLARYLILGLMLLATFLLSITHPVLRSFCSDAFDEEVPEMESVSESSPRPSHEITLKVILENDALASSFQVFVAKELSAENLFFYRMIDKYKRPNDNVTEEARLNWARTIANRFVVPGCVTEVNLKKEVQEEILNSLKENKAPVNLFDAAQREVFALMERDSLQRFLKETSIREGTLRHQSLINPTGSSMISSVVVITSN